MRKSGVELLKIVAIFLVVVSHVTITLCAPQYATDSLDYIVTLGSATTDIRVVLLMLLRQTGVVGNTIFFVCSAWFLLDRKDDGRKKAFSVLSTVWSVSMLMLCVYLIACPSRLSVKVIIEQIFPSFFANNWYMTCYIIFLLMYPWLNKILEGIEQKQLFRMVLVCSVLWIVADYFIDGLFFPSDLIIWVTIYLIMAYLKRFGRHIVESLRAGVTILLIGIAGYVGQVVVTNYVGLHVDAFADEVLRWNTNCNPFYIMIAVGSLIIALQAEYKSRFINYVSGLSMYMYLFHENFLFRRFTRPAIWQYLYEKFGYSQVVLLVIGFALVLFLAAAVVSIVYKETVQRLVTRVSQKLYSRIAERYCRIEAMILSIRPDNL